MYVDATYQSISHNIFTIVFLPNTIPNRKTRRNRCFKRATEYRRHSIRDEFLLSKNTVFYNDKVGKNISYIGSMDESFE